MASAPVRWAAATIRSLRRYVSPGAVPGRRTASSASRTNGALSSASEKTATVPTPMARAVRMIRRAISPRLATSSLVTFGMSARGLSLHPEDAEASASLHDVAMDSRQRDPKDAARVAWVDDAVVVHLAGDEEGVRLSFDLLFDRSALLGVGLFIELPAGVRGALPGHD